MDVRKEHYYNLIKNDPTQKANINGWINKRVNDFRKK